MYPANDTGVGIHTVTAAEATASAATVTIGFQPRYVRLFNLTNADTLVEHFAGMDAGSSIDVAAAAVLNAAGSITITSRGFTMGADSIDTADDVIHYMAIR